jgi:cytoskeletal protein CcmA (bactofilin family)
MFTRSTNRGQSTVIGAVLLFGILITALAGYQAVAVPAQNQAAEYDHNQVVQTDMQDLRNAILNVRDAEGTLSTTVRLGTNYPLRLVAINPPRPAGQLATVEPETTVHIENARVVGDVTGDASPLFEEYQTRFVRYSPNYNEYQSAPTTVFEHSLLYNRFTNTDLKIANQQVISGDEVTITLLSGDLSQASAGSISVEARVADGPTDRIPIESDGGGPITIQLPTQSPNLWTDAIGETYSEGESNARIVNSGSNSVTIELRDGGGPYYLQYSRVSVGEDSTPSSDKFDIQRSTSTTDENTDSTYDVQWRAESIEKPGITYNSGTETLEVDRGQTGSNIAIEAVVTESETTEPVDGTGVEFATTDESLLEFGSNTAQTNSSGEVRADITLKQNGETTIFAAAGDDVAVLPVTISGDATTAGFSTVSVSNLDADTNNQQQRFSFTLLGDLSEGDTVEIDVSETTGSIDYPNGNGRYSVTSGSGDVTRETGGVITYTAGANDGAGDIIEISVSGVDTSDTFESSYTVTFSTSGASQETDFDVIERQSGSQNINSPTTGDIYVTGSVSVNNQLDGSVDAGGSVTVNSNGRVTGDVDAGGSVTLNNDVDGSVNAGGQVTINSNGYAGGDVTAEGTVTINGDVAGSITSGDEVIVNSEGSVSGDVIAEDDVTVNGYIAGSVYSDETVTLSSGATIGGDVFVDSASDLVCNGGGQINGMSCSAYKAANY